PIIRPGDTVVDLFPDILAHIIYEHPARACLKGESVGIAQTQRPDSSIHSCGSVEERIVSRDRAVRVDAQNLSEEICERLRVGGISILADCNVELTVGAEVDSSAIVIGSTTQIIKLQNDRFAARSGDVSVHGIRSKA